MWNKEPKTVADIVNEFPTEEACIEHLEKIKWNVKVVSPFDSSSKVYKTKVGWQCKNTGKNFNVKTNSIFEGSRIPMIKWFCGIFMVMKEPKITSVKFGFYLDITQKSSWYMIKRIKAAFLNLDENDVPIGHIKEINKVLKSNKVASISK